MNHPGFFYASSKPIMVTADLLKYRNDVPADHEQDLVFLSFQVQFPEPALLVVVVVRQFVVWYLHLKSLVR